MATAGKFKFDVKSNAKSVLAWTREYGRLLPAAQAAALVNLLLGAVEQADQTGIVMGHETGKDESWYAIPVAGADHPTAKPTAYDFKHGAAKITSYVRNAKGQILDRRVERLGTQSSYLFKDKVVSRTGELHDDMSFDMEGDVQGYQLDAEALREAYLMKSNLGGMEIVADDGGAILRTTATNDGQKVATLEKRGIQSGKGRPRYIIRKALISVSKRYSTSMRKELAKAAKLAEKAKESKA